MENLDDSENNAKVSDSAYSCSNSQSRSSKSTRSGSNSSGSSGYRGEPSTSSSSSNAPNQPPEKRKEKESKKKKLTQAEAIISEQPQKKENRPIEPPQVEDEVKIKEKLVDVNHLPAAILSSDDHTTDKMEVSAPARLTSKEEIPSPITNSIDYGTTTPTLSCNTTAAGFSCVISMDDGVVIYTTSSVTDTIGFPKDMWMGRSFIDFIHPRDRNTFASQITSGLAMPKIGGMQIKDQTSNSAGSTMLCRIKKYRGLTNSEFDVKVRSVVYMPFMLKLSFKDIKDDDEGKCIYLVVQATPFFSAFKTPNEILTKSASFVMRHVANGTLEYIDQESVPYLGYLPQDLTQKCVLQLYHPDDLSYLKQVYETIVKEGKASRSKAYRMMVQNGDYVTLQTEWSSFINPWSMKLEFVIGRHHVIEGPSRPDVFQQPDPETAIKQTEEEKSKAQSLRESIIRIMNEVLTKPAELAKQQKSKRCQDLATFMESLMEDQPRTDSELCLEIQDHDHSYFERDSVMLGEISPHHKDNDGQSSVETPLSYNQLNYNETLQRYFASHQSQHSEKYNSMPVQNWPILEEPKASTSKCLSPVAHNSVNSDEAASSCGSGAPLRSNSSSDLLVDYRPIRLTAMLINKHNDDMEKDLVKKHRENRSSTKCDRVKVSNENRLKKKEHLARCNASFQPTVHQQPADQPHGLKRSSKQPECGPATTKHHCSTAFRQAHRRQQSKPALKTVSTAANVATTNWTTTSASYMNSYLSGVQSTPAQMPQHMPVVISPTPVPSVVPIYYLPTTAPASANPMPTQSKQQFQAPVQYMMYPQPVFSSAIMYSPLSPQVTFPSVNRPLVASQAASAVPLRLTSTNYEQACTLSPSLKTRLSTQSYTTVWRERIPRTASQATPSMADHGTGVASSNIRSSTSALNRSTETILETGVSQLDKIKERLRPEESTGRTDGESSCSSFYSSFFKTESGSAEETSDRKNNLNLDNSSQLNEDVEMSYQCTSSTSDAFYDPNEHKSMAKRKIEPPWMDQVCMSSELIYRYQIMTKNVDEVLQADLKKMQALDQPSLVNEQLGQLYLDLQLEGVAARLTLEEGITSSASSGEETTTQGSKGPKRKKSYSKLVMIHEEDAPLPPPNEQDKDVTTADV